MAPIALVAALLAPVPSFHLLLSDGNRQLEGQVDRVAENVAKSFSKMGIEVIWSSDPSDPSLPLSNVVRVIVLPRSSTDWGLESGVLAVTRRNPEGEATVVVFYKEVETILEVNQLRSTRTLQGWSAPGRRAVNGVSTVVVHEILPTSFPDDSCCRGQHLRESGRGELSRKRAHGSQRGDTGCLGGEACRHRSLVDLAS